MDVAHTKTSKMLLTSVIRHMPVLTSHILMVLSLEPESRKGPGFPLFLDWSGRRGGD